MDFASNIELKYPYLKSSTTQEIKFSRKEENLVFNLTENY